MVGCCDITNKNSVALQEGQTRQCWVDGWRQNRVIDKKTYRQTNKHPIHTIHRRRILSLEYQFDTSLLQTPVYTPVSKKGQQVSSTKFEPFWQESGEGGNQLNFKIFKYPPLRWTSNSRSVCFQIAHGQNILFHMCFTRALLLLNILICWHMQRIKKKL